MENQNINQKKKKDGLKTLLIISIILTAVAAGSIIADEIGMMYEKEVMHHVLSGQGNLEAWAHVSNFLPYMIFFVMLIGIGIVNIIFSIKTAVKAKHATYVGSVALTRTTFIILPIIAVSLFVVSVAVGGYYFVVSLIPAFVRTSITEEQFFYVLDMIRLFVNLSGGTICAVGILQIIFCAINLKGKKKHAVQA